MKTKLVPLCLTTVLLASCGEKRSNPDTGRHGSVSPENTYLLTTDLPPELIEGTPQPIRLPGVNPLPIPAAEARSPGTERVFFTPPFSQPPAAGVQSPGRQRMTYTAPVREAPAMHQAIPQPPPADRERYDILVDNRWLTPAEYPLSTFSVDVDTASYANVRGMIQQGRAIPHDAVRLEEMVNYFGKLRYKRPAGGESILLERPHIGEPLDFGATDADFRFAASVAMAAMLMRNAEGMADLRLESAAAIARSALGHDPYGRRVEFIALLDQLAARR